MLKQDVEKYVTSASGTPAVAVGTVVAAGPSADGEGADASGRSVTPFARGDRDGSGGQSSTVPPSQDGDVGVGNGMLNDSLEIDRVVDELPVSATSEDPGDDDGSDSGSSASDDDGGDSSDSGDSPTRTSRRDVALVPTLPPVARSPDSGGGRGSLLASKGKGSAAGEAASTVCLPSNRKSVAVELQGACTHKNEAVIGDGP